MDRYFSDGKVNLENLQIIAKPLPKPMSFKKFAEQFGTDKKTVIHSPISDVVIDVKSQYHKMKTWKENRLKISGAIKETIEDPLVIIKHKGAIKYYAPFIDKNNLVHVLSIIENENEIDILKSNFEPFRLNTLTKLLSVNDKDILYIRDIDLMKERSEANSINAEDPSSPIINIGGSHTSAEIIPKNNNFVKFDVEYTAGNLYTDLEAMEAFYEISSLKKVEEIIKTPERNIIYSQYMGYTRPFSIENAGNLSNASGITNGDPNINQIIPINNKKSS